MTTLCHMCARHEGYKERGNVDIFKQFLSYAENTDAREVLSHAEREGSRKSSWKKLYLR